jgi:hypothetical protein
MKHPILSLSLLTTSILASSHVNADALIGPNLTNALNSNQDAYNVIVTGNDLTTLNTEIQTLSVPYVSLQTLPMVGTTLNKAQIEALAQNPSIKASIKTFLLNTATIHLARLLVVTLFKIS